MGLSSDEKANQFYEKRKKRKRKEKKKKRKGKWKEREKSLHYVIWDNSTRNKYNAEKGRDVKRQKMKYATYDIDVLM